MDVDGVQDTVRQPLAPDFMLPPQFFGRDARRRRESGERRLLVAILIDAMNIRQRRCRLRRNAPALQRETERWFASRERRWPFAFESICDTLELDAGRIRRLLADQEDRSTTLRPHTVAA